MAGGRPAGTATTSDQKTMLRVPTTIGSTPNRGSANDGAHSVPSRKSPIGTSWKKSIAPDSNESTIPAVIATETAAQPPSRSLTSRSPGRGPAAASDRRGEPAPAPAAATRFAIAGMPPASAADEPVDRGQGFVLLLLGHGDGTDRAGDLLVVVDVEPDELLHLGPLQAGAGDVDVQPTGERGVRPVLRGLDRRSHATAATVDLERLDPVLVLGVVPVPDEEQAADRALDPDDAGGVVLTDVVVVGADGALLAVDRFGEVVEGARVTAGAVELQRLVEVDVEVGD